MNKNQHAQSYSTEFLLTFGKKSILKARLQAPKKTQRKISILRTTKIPRNKPVTLREYEFYSNEKTRRNEYYKQAFCDQWNVKPEMKWIISFRELQPPKQDFEKAIVPMFDTNKLNIRNSKSCEWSDSGQLNKKQKTGNLFQKQIRQHRKKLVNRRFRVAVFAVIGLIRYKQRQYIILRFIWLRNAFKFRSRMGTKFLQANKQQCKLILLLLLVFMNPQQFEQSLSIQIKEKQKLNDEHRANHDTSLAQQFHKLSLQKLQSSINQTHRQQTAQQTTRKFVMKELIPQKFREPNAKIREYIDSRTSPCQSPEQKNRSIKTSMKTFRISDTPNKFTAQSLRALKQKSQESLLGFGDYTQTDRHCQSISQLPSIAFTTRDQNEKKMLKAYFVNKSVYQMHLANQKQH